MMKSFSVSQWRIADANLNRIGEGLRVLEEFARLSLNDAGLTQRLKDLRHRMVHIDSQLQQELLLARDAAGDVGADMAAEGQEKPQDITGKIAANARRVQESLRVMEELARGSGHGLEPEVYRKARFTIYTIEQELLAGMLRQEKVAKLAGLYAIIDTGLLRGRSYNEVAAQVIQGGARIIQLRDKVGGIREFLTAANELKKICEKNDILFIINDSLEAALAAEADGLHVGQDDLPVATARRLLPVDKILGASARTVAEAKKAWEDGADYLGVGAMYATATKAAAEVVGPGRIKEIKSAVNLPVVAIGGINNDNAGEVMRAGADAAAVISAVMGAADVEEATRQMVEIIKGEQRGRT
jgi:thiamine-phosphate pyrophosphorylase